MAPIAHTATRRAGASLQFLVFVHLLDLLTCICVQQSLLLLLLPLPLLLKCKISIR